MSFTTSSQIGVDLNNPSSTALFTLGQKVLGNNDSEWTYVIATGTLTTGMCCSIFSAGTAYAFTTALLNGGDTAGTTGFLDLGFAQFTIPQGQYGFVARRGINMYVACTGTVPPVPVAFSPTAGVLITALAAAVGMTAAGIFITTSASTATLSVAQAIITYPRGVAATPGM